MIIYSKAWGLILNLIIVGAIILALSRMESSRGKIVLIFLTVLLFVTPSFIPVIPPDWKWMTLYLSKIGVGLFCLLYVRLKR